MTDDKDFKILPRYPLYCPNCGHPSFKCLNFWDALWRCGECGHTRFVTEEAPCYQAIPPNFAVDFPYSQLVQVKCPYCTEKFSFPELPKDFQGWEKVAVGNVPNRMCCNICGQPVD